MKPLAPLRKVIGTFYWPNIINGMMVMCLYEGLECGHMQLRRQSALGPYKAIRRRCEACRIIGKKP